LKGERGRGGASRVVLTAIGSCEPDTEHKMESAGWEWLVCDPRMQTFASCIMGFMVVYMIFWFMVYMRTRAVRGRFREAKIRETMESCKKEQSKISVLLPCKGVHDKTWSNWYEPPGLSKPIHQSDSCAPY
jgi:hypothetical protein